MLKETHPYIHHFNDCLSYKYLIVGTFPPNKAVREDKKSWANFFYGNKGTIWKIIQQIYPHYNFDKAKKEDRVQLIKDWMEEYGVGITDTISECSRKNIKSSDDKDLIIDWEGYNHNLKKYVLANINEIEKIIFTSNTECNSALQTFKIIMGAEFNLLPEHKLETTMPSPSGSSNTTMFNVNDNQTLGLYPDLFHYIKAERKDLIVFFENRWNIKQRKKQLTGEEKKKVVIPNSPKGILADYKIWKYAQALPKVKLMNDETSFASKI